MTRFKKAHGTDILCDRYYSLSLTSPALRNHLFQLFPPLLPPVVTGYIVAHSLNKVHPAQLAKVSS